MKRDELRRLTRDELLARAEALGVGRPAVLTQAELMDEVVKRTGSSASGMRGWLGRARDLVAQVVSKGLHLPDAAKLFRGEPPEPLPAPPPPLPTVTLAEIYAAQGHLAKALSVLGQVLEREPSHEVAKDMKATFELRLPVAATTIEALAPKVEPSFRDDLTLTILGGARAQIDWELRPVRLARLAATAPHGALVVRLYAVSTQGGAVATKTEDVAVHGVDGRVVTDAPPSGGHLRACLAWKTDAAFLPLVVGAAEQVHA